jgi:RNA polymerase sigma-70 factor (ECF subfamily)
MGLFSSVARIQLSAMILAAAMHPETPVPADESIARLRRGDLDALRVLLPQYQVRLYRFLLRLVREQAAAEDLFQQTWVRVMERIGKYDARYRFDAWLFSVARNLAIDHLRVKRGFSLDDPGQSGEASVERLTSSGRDPLEQVLEHERAAILEEAMGNLPLIHREVLALRFEDGMSLEQIASVAGIPLSTVKSRLSRALQNLRAEVEKRT